jgi:hypothetical protein
MIYKKSSFTIAFWHKNETNMVALFPIKLLKIVMYWGLSEQRVRLYFTFAAFFEKVIH